MDKICLYAKDLHKAEYKFLINKHGGTGIQHCKDSKAFIEYSKDMEDIYERLKKKIQIRNVKH